MGYTTGVDHGRMTRGAMAVVICFAVASWVIYALMPRISDDLWYSLRLYPFIEEGRSGGLLRAMADTVADHMRGDNLRPGNLLLVPSLLLPRWVAAIVPALACGWLASGFCRFCFRRDTSLLGATVAVGCLSFGLPWFEELYVLCYAYNYIVPAAMTVWYAASLTGRAGSGKWAMLNAALLGAWHEGFALPLCVGTLAAILLSPPSRRRPMLRLLAMLAIGTAYSVGCRLAIFLIYPADVPPPMMGLRALLYGKLQVPMLLYLGVLLAVWFSRKRGLGSAPVAALVLVASAIAFIIQIRYVSGERGSVIIHLLAMMGTLRLLDGAFPVWWRPGSGWGKAVASLGLLLLGWHYAEVTRASLRFHDEVGRMARQLKERPYGTHFVEFTLPEAGPLIAWRKPEGLFFSTWNTRWLDAYYRVASGSGAHEPIVVVPLGLKGVTPSGGVPVPGGSDIRRVGEWYFRPDDGRPEGFYDGKVGPFNKRIFFHVYPFEGADGHRYQFLYTVNSYFPTMFFPITRLEGQTLRNSPAQASPAESGASRHSRRR